MIISKNTSINKISLNIISILLFITSPFLALPTIIIGLVNSSKFSRYLFILLYSFLSYLYVPNYSDDKTRYLEIYEGASNFSYSNFIFMHWSISHDFILQLLFKIGKDIDIKPQWIFFFVTSIVVSILLKVYDELVKGNNRLESFISILLILTSVTFLELFSGTRFMLALIIAIFASYEGIFLNKKWNAIILWVLVVNIHFSFLPFFLLYVVYFYLRPSKELIKYCFLISFIFFLIPKDFIINIFKVFNLTGALGSKAEFYVGSKTDFSSNYFKESKSSGLIILILRSVWVYALYIYLLINLKFKDNFFYFLILSTALMNFFYPFQTVYLRYSIFIKILLVFTLIANLKNIKTKKYGIIFICSFLLIQISQIIIMRYNIEESYNENNFFLIDILNQEPMNSNQTLK